MNSLLIDEPRGFYSYKDEKYFFLWLESIEAIKEIKGSAKGLNLSIEDPIDEDSLADLISLMARYEINMKCLKKICETHPNAWFRDKKNYWYTDVFGK